MEQVVFESEGLKLVGRLRSAAGGGAVICHPHPRFGGSMDNNVVAALEDILFAAGLSTLAFNFRGVGGSDGAYGDMHGEIEDAIAALDFLAEWPGAVPARLVLAGYSFGGLIALFAAARMIEEMETEENEGAALPPRALILISPMPGAPGWEKAPAVAPLFTKPPPTLIVTGDRDDICPPKFAQALSGLLGSRLLILEHSDHFYLGREELLSDPIRELLAALPGGG
jgi:hypothetical protein